MFVTQCITLVPHVRVIIVNGLFQALGRPVGTMVLGRSRQAICLIPSVVLLSRLFGVYGLDGAQATAGLLSFLVALPMVIHLLHQIRQHEIRFDQARLASVEQKASLLLQQQKSTP